METYYLLWAASIILILLGFVGLIAPILPGSAFLLAGFFLGAYIDDFAYVGWGTLSVLVLLAILMHVIDFVMGAIGAKRFGASRRGMTGGLIGALVGFFFGLPGIFLGPFVGAVLGELSFGRDLHAAGRAGMGATLGMAVGAALKLAIVFSMIGIFVVMRLTWKVGA